MRVTNGMIRNTTLNGLYSNMNALNKTYAQMATGKKIQTVSDDPIIAGRALKLTTSVLEATQYISNAKEAMSWMEITESSLDNMTEVLKNVSEKINQAANGPLGKDDKEAIKTTIEQMLKQVQEDANATYGGRYIFSGYKTNQPVVLTQNTKLETATKLSLNISSGGDSKIAAGSIFAEGTILSGGSTIGTGTTINAGSTIGAGTTLSMEDFNTMFAPDMELESGSYTYDADCVVSKDTVMSEEAKKALADIDQTIEFEEVTDDAGNITGYTLKEDFTIPAGQKFDNAISQELTGHSFDGTTYTTTTSHITKSNCELEATMEIGNKTVLKGETTIVGEDTVIAEYSAIKAGSTLTQGTELAKGTLNPVVVGNIDNQNIEYEIGVSSTIAVNVGGMDEVLSKIVTCLSEIALMVDESLDDSAVSNADLDTMFTNKLDEVDGLLQEISQKASDLGSRMNRVEYTQTRLTDQKTTFTNLLSETEDVDVEEVYTKFNVQYATYQSALQATSKIITNTLADYL